MTLHTTTRPVREADVIVRDGIRLTGPVRSMLDAAGGGMAPEQVERAARDAVERGMTTERELLRAARERSARVANLVEQAVGGAGEA